MINRIEMMRCQIDAIANYAIGPEGHSLATLTAVEIMLLDAFDRIRAEKTRRERVSRQVVAKPQGGLLSGLASPNNGDAA